VQEKPEYAVYHPREYNFKNMEDRGAYNKLLLDGKEANPEDYPGEWIADHVEFKNTFTIPVDESKQIIYTPFPPIWRQPGHPVDPGDFNQLYDEIRDFIYVHADLPDTRLYDILTCWIIATWLLEVWDVVGYVFLLGPRSSGKTRVLEILSALSYRGMLTPNISGPALFRVTEKLKPTLCLDETEIYNREDKSDIQNILNSGYKRGQFALRVKMIEGGEDEIQTFDVFGFKALAGTNELLGTLESRSIVISMMKATRKVRFLMDNEWATRLRSRLLMWRFRILTDTSVTKALRTLFTGASSVFEFTDDGRLAEIYAALYSVHEKGRSSIVEYVRDQVDTRRGEDEASVEAQLVEAICRSKPHVRQKRLLPVSDLARVFNENREPSDQLSTDSIGRLMKRIGLGRRKITVEGTSIRGYVWDEARIQRLARRYGLSSEVSGFKNDTSLDEAIGGVKSVPSVHESQVSPSKDTPQAKVESPPNPTDMKLIRIALGLLKESQGRKDRGQFFSAMLEAGFNEETVIKVLSPLKGWIIGLENVNYTPENKPITSEARSQTMDETQLAIRIRKTFEDSHNLCSTDFLASRLGIDSEEDEKTLKNLEREGRVTFDKNHETWKWVW